MCGKVGAKRLWVGVVLAVAVGCGDMTPESAEERRVKNNLRLIGIALHQFHEENGHFPYAGSNPTPSTAEELDVTRTHWRVALLPYLEQDNLYRSLFKRGPYWKDASIRKTIIPVYSPIPAVENRSLTHFRVFVGKSAAFHPENVLKRSDFSDGPENTILVVEAEEPVNWASAESLAYDPGRPLPKLGHPSRDGFFALMGDGTVRYIPKNVEESLLRALITRDGGEALTGSLPGR